LETKDNTIGREEKKKEKETFNKMAVVTFEQAQDLLNLMHSNSAYSTRI